MKLLLNPEGLWDVEMQILGDEGSFDYYGYVFRKAQMAEGDGQKSGLTKD